MVSSRSVIWLIHVSITVAPQKSKAEMIPKEIIVKEKPLAKQTGSSGVTMIPPAARIINSFLGESPRSIIRP